MNRALAVLPAVLLLSTATPALASTPLAACERSTASTDPVGALWSRAIATIDSAARADAQVPVRVFQHLLDPRSRKIRDAREDRVTRTASRLFSSLPPDSIPVSGYIVESENDVSYYAPDLIVLRAPSFYESRCFSVRKPGKNDGGMIGLNFKPEKSRPGVSDIEGTFWFDSTTRELQRMEFRYTGVPASYTSAGVGGELTFARTAKGIPLLRGWEIRMPEGTVQSRQKLQHSQSRLERFVTVDHLRVAGGAVEPNG